MASADNQPTRMGLGSGRHDPVDGSHSPGTQEKAAPSRVKRWAIGLAIIAGLVGGAYLWGRLQTAGRIQEAEQRVKAADSVAQRESGETRLAAGKIAELDARRSLDLSLRALDERNFGTAQEHLARAAALLKRGDLGVAADLAELQKALAQHKLVATEDLSPQRQRLRGWMATFDEQRPLTKPKM